MRCAILFILVLSLLLLAGCEDAEEKTVLPTRPAPSTAQQGTAAGQMADTAPTTPEPAKAYSSFHYQLQDADYSSLKTVDADVLVIDPDDAALTKEEISNLKGQGRLVLAYLSIGEAEDYRDYWKSSWRPGSPAFIDKENPEWEGNYKVKYWDPGWQAIILDRAAEIATQGYDGAYLDIIDAYGYYEDQGRSAAAKEMVRFVEAIRDAARKVNSGFMVVPQNAPELYQYADYAAAIAGFGKEDTWYDDDNLQDEEETGYVLGFLDRAVADGKFVLAIDYPSDRQSVCDFYRKCRAHGFACTVSGRELDLDRPVMCSS